MVLRVKDIWWGDLKTRMLWHILFRGQMGFLYESIWILSYFKNDFSPMGSWIRLHTEQFKQTKKVYQTICVFNFHMQKWTTDRPEMTDVSAHAFFSAHEAKTTPRLYRHNCKLLTVDLNQWGIIFMPTISLYNKKKTSCCCNFQK